MRDRRCDTATGQRGNTRRTHIEKNKKNKTTGTHTTSGRARWMFKWCPSNCPAMDACELNVAVFTFTK